MDGQHDLATGHGGDDLTGVGVGDQQSQREIGAGDLGSGLRPPDIEGRVIAEPAEDLGSPGDGLVEVVPVRGIHQRVEVDQSVLVDLADVEVPPVGCGLALGFGRLGVEPQNGFGDEAFELGPPDAGGVEQLPVHESRCLGR
ncbi:hypothetical protein FHP29_15830 [Nocardioides albidus]|uniref:Uncharacterized protein n=1 Tax=Nocardioides albidus TaxID=1517589 RepID=A0A5C4VN71_9ACTN|nr:hypothetical protein FHP29_15830 [Nocardioides albidus]